MRVLCNRRVKIVLNHKHDCRCLFALCRIFFYRTSIHFVRRAETIHIYTSVLLQFFCKFLCQNRVKLLIEISQCVFECQFLLFLGKNVLTLWSMAHTQIIFLQFGQVIGNTFNNCFSKFHNIFCFCDYNSAIESAKLSKKTENKGKLFRTVLV